MLALIQPALKVALAQFRAECRKRGEATVCGEMAANLSAMLDQLTEDDRRLALAILTDVRQVRDCLGAPVA